MSTAAKSVPGIDLRQLDRADHLVVVRSPAVCAGTAGPVSWALGVRAFTRPNVQRRALGSASSDGRHREDRQEPRALRTGGGGARPREPDAHRLRHRPRPLRPGAPRLRRGRGGAARHHDPRRQRRDRELPRALRRRARRGADGRGGAGRRGDRHARRLPAISPGVADLPRSRTSNPAVSRAPARARRHARRSSPRAARSSGRAARGATAARSTDPGIASSSGGRPAAMSRCIELPSVACAARARSIARAESTSVAPSALRDGARLLDRADQIGAQLGRRADLAEQLVVGARRTRERVQAHELGPHHLCLRRLRRGTRPRGRAPRRRRSRPRARPSARPPLVGAGHARRAGTGSCGRRRPARGGRPRRGSMPASTRLRQRIADAARPMWSRPFSSGNTSRRARRRRAPARASRPAALVATISASTGSSQARRPHAAGRRSRRT